MLMHYTCKYIFDSVTKALTIYLIKTNWMYFEIMTSILGNIRNKEKNTIVIKDPSCIKYL